MTMRVAVGIWNIQEGEHFKHKDTIPWLVNLPKHTQKTRPDIADPAIDFDQPYDVYAIGFQEIGDPNADDVSSICCFQVPKDFATNLQKTISKKHKYVLLKWDKVAGVCLFVFTRPSLVPHMTEVAVETEKLGLPTSNKGAVAVRFKYHGTSMCFVCAHFAAHQDEVEDRNSHYKEVCSNIEFPEDRNIFSHDYVFWCGDLNYRIDIPNEEVKRLIKEKNWAALQAHDQLNRQREAGNVFNDFHEGPTNFAPTYKYDTCTDNYDTSEKQRIPAWCDRVLWHRKPRNEENVNIDPGKLLLYNRAEVKTSDHRPVLAIFDVELEEDKQ